MVRRNGGQGRGGLIEESVWCRIRTQHCDERMCPVTWCGKILPWGWPDNLLWFYYPSTSHDTGAQVLNTFRSCSTLTLGLQSACCEPHPSVTQGRTPASHTLQEKVPAALTGAVRVSGECGSSARRRKPVNTHLSLFNLAGNVPALSS